MGTRDNGPLHKEGNFPTSLGKFEFKIEGALNLVASPFRQMYEGFQSGD